MILPAPTKLIIPSQPERLVTGLSISWRGSGANVKFTVTHVEENTARNATFFHDQMKDATEGSPLTGQFHTDTGVLAFWDGYVKAVNVNMGSRPETWTTQVELVVGQLLQEEPPAEVKPIPLADRLDDDTVYMVRLGFDTVDGERTFRNFPVTHQSEERFLARFTEGEGPFAFDIELDETTLRRDDWQRDFLDELLRILERDDLLPFPVIEFHTKQRVVARVEDFQVTRCEKVRTLDTAIATFTLAGTGRSVICIKPIVTARGATIPDTSNWLRSLT